jgi:hypothetical protein
MTAPKDVSTDIVVTVGNFATLTKVNREPDGLESFATRPARTEPFDLPKS